MADSARDLYLDLLVKTLTNTVYRDSSIRDGVDEGYRPELRRIGLDWPGLAHTMVGVNRLRILGKLVQRVLDKNIPGDFIEAGVWRGGCCILMRGLLAANQITDRKVYVADSFAGVPPSNPDAYPSDRGYNLDAHRELAISLEQVKDNFDRYGLLDDQVVFVKGWFSDTLPSLQAGPFALIRLDGDLYESTHDALEALYPKLSPGGVIIIDDYYFIPPCREAVDEFRSRLGITAPMRKIDWNAAWWRKD